ncbi:MAG: DUF6067 family protein [Kiritimatiellae bacterium]|nr:DUF6067 family protein [Kiritimatiellia bacterium]
MKKTVTSMMIILSACWVVAGAGEATEYPLDWRYDQYEPGISLLADNALAGAKLTASGQWDKFGPERVVDGNLDAASHWACEQLPATLTIEMKQAAQLGYCQIWLYYDRVYKFFIESSLDGKNWQRVVDWTKNQKPATREGFNIPFDKTVEARFLRVTVTDSSVRAAGAHIVELKVGERYTENAGSLQGRVIPADKIKPADVVAESGEQSWKGCAWRNERINGQFVVWSASAVPQLRLSCAGLRSTGGGSIAAEAVSLRFVRNVLGGNKLYGDVLDNAQSVDLAAGAYRPVWLTIKVPADAKPGLYTGDVAVKGAAGQQVNFKLELQVLNAVLPEPAAWSFYLDLWQHPWAVARYHGVKPFSPEHYALMRPILKELAESGQKTLTTTIVDKPWNNQNFDPYYSMIEHIKTNDNGWRFDYTLFDEYVAFGESCGLNQHIHCYTMITWGNMVSYTDAASGDKIKLHAVPGSKEHEAYWGDFLRDFEKHLKAKGWLERTYIAMDERGADELRATLACIRKYAPGLKVSMAGNHAPSTFKGLVFDNYSQSIGQVTDDFLKEVQSRRSEGRITTFYICCSPLRPNTFVFSPSAEQWWLGYYAAANNLDGLLRWAFANWIKDPLYNTAFGSWPDGDTFLVYPGLRSSLRWESLRDGIEEYEKIRILRENALIDSELSALFREYSFKQASGSKDAELAALVQKTRAAVEKQSAKLKQ